MEDLNVHRMKIRIVTKCWLDIHRFPNMTSIACATGLAERTIFRIAKDHHLPKRNAENISAYKEFLFT